MELCWYCHWGWPDAVAKIYEEAEAKCGYDPLHFGPSHIVWEDENFEDSHIDFCIAECADLAKYDYSVKTPAQMAVVLESLQKLRAIPEAVRCCEPKEYKGELPDNFPPPPELNVRKHKCHL